VTLRGTETKPKVEASQKHPAISIPLAIKRIATIVIAPLQLDTGFKYVIRK